MALGGTPREETEKYLAEHYSLADPGAASVLTQARHLFAEMGARRRTDECDALLARAGA